MSEQMGTNKYKTLARDTGLFAISNFGSKILNFLLTPLYTIVLATEEFGIADLLNTTIQFLYPILTLSISEATLRFVLDKEKDKTKVLGTSLAFICIAVLILMSISPVMIALNTPISEYWGTFVLMFALFNIHDCFSNFIKADGKTKLFAIQGIINTLSVIISNIILLVVFKRGIRGYLISTILGHIVPLIVIFFAGKIYRHIKITTVDFSLVKEMLAYSIPMIPTILAWSINTGIDKYMITGMIGLSENGIYSVAHKIPTIVTALVSVFLQAWQLSAISNHGEADESGYYTTVFSGLNIISLFGSMMIIIFSKFLCGVLFSESYFLAWKCVPLLCLSAIFSNYAGFLSAAFRAAKKTGALFVSVATGAVSNIVLNFFLIREFGIIGAAMATAASFGIVWIVRFIMVQKIVKVKMNLFSGVISYFLLVYSAVAITFEFVWCYQIAIASIFAIFIVNFKAIALVFLRLKCVFKK